MTVGSVVINMPLIDTCPFPYFLLDASYNFGEISSNAQIEGKASALKLIE